MGKILFNRDFFTIFPDGLPPELPMVCGFGRSTSHNKQLFTHGHGVNTGENTQDLLKTSTSSCLSRRCCTCSCCSSSPSVRSSWSLMPQQRRAKIKIQNPRKSHFFGQKAKGVAHGNFHFLAGQLNFRK